MLQQVFNVVVGEFSDLQDVAGLIRVLIRLLIAALLGGILGWNRTQHGKAAGLRTFMLVAVGSALFILVPQQAGATQEQISRVIQGLVAGIGFLGAGSIIKHREGEKDSQVIGLTTAAGIWMTAAIGVAAGMGRESTAVISTLLALIIFSVLPWLEHAFGSPDKIKERSEAEAHEQKIESSSK